MDFYQELFIVQSLRYDIALLGGCSLLKTQWPRPSQSHFKFVHQLSSPRMQMMHPRPGADVCTMDVFNKAFDGFSMSSLELCHVGQENCAVGKLRTIKTSWELTCKM